jgi:flavodoxin
MKALVVYDSMKGNTKTVAEAIASGIGSSRVLKKLLLEKSLSPQRR